MAWRSGGGRGGWRSLATTCAARQFMTPDRAPPPAASRLDTARPTTWTTGNDSSRAAPCNRASRDCRAPLPDSRHTPGAEWPTTVADGQDDWRLPKKPPQDRLEVNAHSTPQWNYTPEGVLASSPQVGLGGAGLGLRSSELYLKYICSKKNRCPPCLHNLTNWCSNLGQTNPMQT